ncbi:MAG: hypothetical protein LBE34_16310 [Flavobacteriaceae bacterium]|jgi:hypothetical protein|nr:hypothetical protein [Flavobacteriaceae bacterium]
MSKLLSYLGIFICFVFISCGESKTPPNEQQSKDGTATTGSIDQSEVHVEEYKVIPVEEIDKINQTITEKHLTNNDEIMRLYKPEEAAPGKGYTYVIKEINSQDSTSTLVSLNIDNNNHESIKSIKVIMSIQTKDGKPVVTQIKESYKCWEGKGHQEWSAFPCA